MNTPISEVIAVMIPIVAIIMGVGIGMLSLFLDYRKKRDMFAMHHKERLTAIEKGMEVPKNFGSSICLTTLCKGEPDAQ